MVPRTKRRMLGALRIAICGVALWFVIGGVTLRDHLVLKEGGQHLVGTVIEEEGGFTVLLPGGQQRVVTLAEVALDEDGAPRVSYGLKTALGRSNKWLLLLAVLIHLPVGVLQAIRLRWLLAAQQICLSYWACVKLSYAGNFLNFAAPLGSTAGDVFKAYFVSLHTTRKTEAMTTIVLDRILGLGTLVLVVAVIAGASPSGSRLGQFRFYLLGLLALGVAAVFAYFSPMLRRRFIPRAWLARQPMLEQLERIDNTARVLAAHKPVVAAAVGITALLQAIALCAYCSVAVALALTVNTGNLFEFFAYFYTGCVVQSLPGPPQGLGTVELAYRYFFAPYGSPSQIVCMAFAIRVVVLACALPGVLVTLTGAYKPSVGRSLDQSTEPAPSERAANCSPGGIREG